MDKVDENLGNDLKFENKSSNNTLQGEKTIINSQSIDSNDPEEICNNLKPPQEVQHKDLMNCIAYEKCGTNDGQGTWNEVRYSDDFDSLSSDTTSDITDVSPQPLSPLPSSSGCSSMIKTELGGENTTHKSWSSKKEHKIDKKFKTNTANMSKNKETMKEDQDEHTLQFLKEALHSLDCQSSVKTAFSSVGRQIYPQQKNLTFNKEQMRNIDRENMILLRKIQCSRKKSQIDTYSTNYSKVPSSAINRQKQQRRIEYENSILLQKIQRVKGTTNTMSGLRRF